MEAMEPMGIAGHKGTTLPMFRRIQSKVTTRMECNELNRRMHLNKQLSCKEFNMVVFAKYKGLKVPDTTHTLFRFLCDLRLLV